MNPAASRVRRWVRADVEAGTLALEMGRSTLTLASSLREKGLWG